MALPAMRPARPVVKGADATRRWSGVAPSRRWSAVTIKDGQQGRLGRALAPSGASRLAALGASVAAVADPASRLPRLAENLRRANARNPTNSPLPPPRRRASCLSPTYGTSRAHPTPTLRRVRPQPGSTLAAPPRRKQPPGVQVRLVAARTPLPQRPQVAHRCQIQTRLVRPG